MTDRVGGLDPYVPRIASNWDVHAAGSLWRPVDGSLVFVDISGFTNLSERLARRGRIGAEELTGVLNRVFGNMLEIVFDRGGSLLKFGGDALLLLFDTADHVIQACAATIEMRRALRDASREKTSVGRIDLKMSSGIHTGSVDFFLVGDSHRELIVTGPAASLTTEMEGTADAGEIVVSDAVRAQVPSDFTGEPRGNGWLLRKRTIQADACGPVVRLSEHKPDLATFVPRQLRQHLGSGLAEPEHRIATIGFLKFKGVDAMLAEQGYEAVGAALKDLVVTAQAALDEEDLTFLASDIDADGGKLIFAAGVPTSQHDDEGRMLRAARRIVDTDCALSTRIGLNRGHVFAGDVGTVFRRTFTVMGDTVNLAARLMAAAQPGSLYASPGVLDESSTLFRTRALEPFYVKGKEEPVSAYEVFEETGVRPPDTKHELPFHGREAELEMLVSIVTTCARVGRGGMMTIAGDTGIGKSRLIAEVIERCPGLATLVVKAEPNGSDNPYWAFRDPMRRKLGVERSDPDTMARVLREKVTAIDRKLLPLLPLLGDVLHIEIPDNKTTASIDPRFRPERTADVTIDLLSALHTDPFALIAEDGQWLDEASRNLLIRFGKAAETKPWTVIVTMRDIGGSDVDVFGDGIALAPLDDDTIRQIAIEVTAAAPLRPHELDNIVQRTGGNPLFLSEILSVIRDTGTAENIPDSLDAVVSTQIDTLPPLARQTLRYASVLGTSFPTAVLTEFLAPDDMEIDRATRSVLSRFIEVDGETRLRFKHAVVHDVAYGGLPYRRRRELHGRAGDVVERMAGDDPNGSAEFLAYHFAAAARYPKAWKYSRVAAAKARAAYANNEAASHYLKALEAARSLPDIDSHELTDIWIDLAQVRELTGQIEDARDALVHALRTSSDDVEKRTAILLLRAGVWLSSGNTTQAKRSITTARKEIDRSGPDSHERERARLDAFDASIHATTGELDEAARLARAAIDRGRPLGEDEVVARAYSVLDYCNFVAGSDEPRHGPEAIEIYERLGYLERSVVVINNLGAFAYWEGNWREATEWYEKAVETADRSGNILDAALAKANIAEVRVGQRRFSEARDLLDEAERTFRSTNTSGFMPLVQLLKGRCMLGVGETEAAVSHLAALVEEQETTGETDWTNETHLALAEALVVAGRPDEGLDVLDRRSELVEEAPSACARIRALALTPIDTEKARVLLLSAVDLASEAGDPYAELLALEALTGVVDAADADYQVTARLRELRDGLGVLSPSLV